MQFPKKAIPALILLFSLFMMFSVFLSCSKRTVQDISKDVRKDADTLSHKLNRDVDTIVNKLSSSDSIFNAVKIIQADTLKIASRDFRKKINDIFSYYIDIKDNLIRDDSIKIQPNAKEMRRALTDLQNHSASGEPGEWKNLYTKLDKSISDLGNSDVLQKQRMFFGVLTDNMLDFIKRYGLYNKTIYYMECDKMAGSKMNTWLTDNKNTDNPYYGLDKGNEKSSPCAKVKEAWKFN